MTTAAGACAAPMAVFAVNAATGALPPLRNRLTVSSSHIVCTEPVPDVLDALGWRGGESISDGRALLHYLRTTRDDRILFGWAGGRMAAGARTGGRMEVDPERRRAGARALVRFFPQLEGRAIAHAWGGPIDVSPTHRPAIVGLRGLPAWAAFGFTGNGVGAVAPVRPHARRARARPPRPGHPAPVRRSGRRGASRPSRCGSPAPPSSAARSSARRRPRRRAARPTRSRPRSPRSPG